MIDTIRFRVPLKSIEYELFKSKSIEWSKKDNRTGELHFKVYKTTVDLGSYDRSVNVMLSESYPNECKVEFSVPKHLYGQNVHLIYPDQIKPVIHEVWSNLFKYFSFFPHYNKWEILRLDICYAWKFQNNLIADNILQIIKSYDYPRKDKMTYDTSLMLAGDSYSLKWYLKHPEYYKHDFKALLKKDDDYAHKMESVAQGVLRFEVTMRKKSLQYHWEKRRVYLSDLNYDIIQEKLKFFFLKFFHGAKPTFMNTQEVCNRLILKYGSSKAKDIYEFYLIYTSGNKEAYNNYKRLVSDRTIRYYKNCLKKAEIGINTNTNHNLDFDFSIPSPYVVNSSAPSAVARLAHYSPSSNTGNCGNTLP